MAKKYD
jgi:hypothetical protein